MDIGLATPAIMFPAVSLVLLAYTQKYLALAQLVRRLHVEYKASPEDYLLRQIRSMRKRLYLIRNMQAAGIIAFLFCVIAMLLIYLQATHWGSAVFALSLGFFILSMLFSLRETQLSLRALDLELSDAEKKTEGPGGLFW